MYNNNYQPYYEVRQDRQNRNNNNRPSWGTVILIVLVAAILGGTLGAVLTGNGSSFLNLPFTEKSEKTAEIPIGNH